MDFPFELLFAALAVLYGAPGVIARMRQKVARESTITEVALDDLAGEHRAASAFLQHMKDILEELGFGYVGTVRSLGANESRVYAARLVNAGAHTVAHALFTITPRRSSSSVSFETQLAEGPTIATNNSTISGILPPRPCFEVYNFMSANPIALFKNHELLLENGYRGKARVPPDTSKDVVALQRTRAREAVEHLIASGHFEPASATNLLRPTWKGAYLATWKLSWPIKQLLRARCARKASRVLASQK